MQTIPDGLVIKASGVPNAGLGVIASVFIPKGTRFGPYEGIIEEKLEHVHRDGYSWQVRSRI